MKFNHKNLVHLVGLYTYCKMRHGAYSVKLVFRLLETVSSGGLASYSSVTTALEIV